MAHYIGKLYEAATAVIGAACPEVTGIYEAEHAAMIPWENYMPPYAVMLVESMTQSPDYSGVNDVYDVTLEVFYVCEVAGPVSPIRDALESIRDGFNSADQMLIQVQRVQSLDWSDSMDVNALFAAKEMPHRAGRIGVLAWGRFAPHLNGINMNIQQSARFYRSLRARLTTAIVRAEKTSVAQTLAAAVVASSGGHSLADLRKAGHPYSVSAPDASYPPAIINDQTGKFRGGWKTVTPRVGGTNVVSGVVNTDPVAAYMAGTKKMVARPIATIVVKRVAVRRRTRLTNAVRKVLSP